MTPIPDSFQKVRESHFLLVGFARTTPNWQFFQNCSVNHDCLLFAEDESYVLL